MAQDYIQLADRSKLAADSKSVTVAGVTQTVKRQQVVVVPGSSLAEQGAAVADAVIAQLVTAGGSPDANVDGSGTPVSLLYQVPAGKALVLDQVELMIRDPGAWTGATFGLVAALTNGVRLDIVDADGATVKLALIPGGVAKKNAELLAIPGAVPRFFWGDTLQLEVPARVEGWPLAVTAGQYVRLKVSDNLTSLDMFRASIRGRLAAV